METKEEKKHGIIYRLKTDVRRRMVTGLLLILPIYVTFFVVKFLFTFIGGTLSPLIRKGLDFYGVVQPKTFIDEFLITFFGLILTFISLYFIGIFAANFVGKSIIHYFENLLTKTPVIRNIYSWVKQIVHAISLPGKQSFKRVVLVDFPKEGIKSIGFVTGNLPQDNKKNILSVFVPTTPNPTTGFLLYVAEEEVIDSKLTVEEAFKTLLSGGVLTPKDFANTIFGAKHTQPPDKTDQQSSNK